MAELVKISCKADEKLNVTMRDGKVILARENDVTRDESQQWYKYYCSTANLSDDNDQKLFVLVNVASQQAMVNKGSDPYTKIGLAPYRGPEHVSSWMLWMEGKHCGGGFCTLIPFRDFSRGLDALRINAEPMREGMEVGLFALHEYDNQLWRMVPIISRTQGPLHVVLVSAIDVSTLPSEIRVDHDIFHFLEGRLMKRSLLNNHLGFVRYDSVKNSYTYVMRAVTETYSDECYTTDVCTENMAWGLDKAHQLITSNDGMANGIILLLSDGNIHKTADFFGGGEDYKSTVPVHTFAIGRGNANEEVLRAIANNSPGGKFHHIPAPQNTFLSGPFKNKLDRILSDAVMK